MVIVETFELSEHIALSCEIPGVTNQGDAITCTFKNGPYTLFYAQNLACEDSGGNTYDAEDPEGYPTYTCYNTDFGGYPHTFAS